MQQVTVDVILPAGTELPQNVTKTILSDGRVKITTIVDGVGVKGRKYFFHEVKATEKASAKAEDLLTTNQKCFKKVLEGKVDGELIPKGGNAKQIFGKESGKNILTSSKMERELNIRKLETRF